MTKKVVHSASARAKIGPDPFAANGQPELPLSWNGNWAFIPSSKVRRPRPGAAFAWAHTYTAFSLSFAKAALVQLGARPSSAILDPFLGSGTTMLAAAMCGWTATGVDISPFSALLSRGRMASSVDIARVRWYLKAGTSGQRELVREGSILPASDMSYAQAVVERICSDRGVPRQELFRVLLADDVGDYDSEVVSLLSLAIGAKDCAKLERGSNPIWYRPSSYAHKRRRGVSLREAARRWGIRVSADLSTSVPLLRRGQQVLNRDFTGLGRSRPEFDVCLTSPPYLNRLDYVVAHLPELTILQLFVPISIEDLRGSMIGTTKIVRKTTDHNVPVEWGPTCGRALKSVANHPSYASRRYYYHTYYQYFERLYGSLKVLRSVMRRDCKGLVVLQDSYYKNVKIQTPRVCVEMLQAIGFSAVIVRTMAVRTHMGRMSPIQASYAPNKTLGESLVHFT